MLICMCIYDFLCLEYCCWFFSTGRALALPPIPSQIISSVSLFSKFQGSYTLPSVFLTTFFGSDSSTIQELLKAESISYILICQQDPWVNTNFSLRVDCNFYSSFKYIVLFKLTVFSKFVKYYRADIVSISHIRKLSEPINKSFSFI